MSLYRAMRYSSRSLSQTFKPSSGSVSARILSPISRASSSREVKSAASSSSARSASVPVFKRRSSVPLSCTSSSSRPANYAPGCRAAFSVYSTSPSFSVIIP